MLGSHYTLSRRSLTAYPEDFAWRFKHRFDLKKSFDAALEVTTHATPSPLFLLEMSLLSNKGKQMNHPFLWGRASMLKA